MNNCSLLRLRIVFAVVLAVVSAAAAVYPPALPAAALDAEDAEDAEEIICTHYVKNVDNFEYATDGDHSTYATCGEGASVTFVSEDILGFFYIEFNHAPGKWTASSGTKVSEHGNFGFIHEFVDVLGAFGHKKSITFNFPAGTEITDIRSFGTGKVPDDVQRWEPPVEKADILLIPAHSDDDQLYFAGLLPYYCTVRRLRVQVAFFTEHLSENYRWHERLDALWASGVRNYPVVSEFPDQYSRNAETAFNNFKEAGYSRQTIEDWLALQLRRFRPLVAVTHALDGEYGHGQHMAAAQTLTSAAELAADPSFATEGYDDYDLPKLYLHSDARETILIDCYDSPFEELGNSTPFRVSQQAYLIHKSQYYADLLIWMFGTVYPVSKPGTITVTRAEQISQYNPRVFGLVRRGAGIPEDVKKNDFMENLLSYEEQAEITEKTEITSVPETNPQQTLPVTPVETATEAESGAESGTVSSPETRTSPVSGEHEPPQSISPAVAVAALAVIVSVAVAGILISRGKRCGKRCAK